MAHDVIGATTSSATVLPQRFTTFTHAVLFMLGFSTIFIVGWSGLARPVGEMFFLYRPWLARVGGLVVTLFGLVRLGLPQRQGDVHRRLGLIQSLLIGVCFAVGWMPCAGSTLRAILALSFAEETAVQGLFLLTSYALGLAVPFLALGLLVDRAAGIRRYLRQYKRRVQIVSGLVLVGMGVLLFFNQMPQLALWALNNGLDLDAGLGGVVAPTSLLAVIAGLLSFLSLCVLLLVPAYLGYLSGCVVGMGVLGSKRR
ncbi:MAG: cytochrome c biogenesis protein CcdA [Chloroflexi bacterium]|nr:cytochrome c biogenesis protein CcdA [Chloroflexota bacterium]